MPTNQFHQPTQPESIPPKISPKPIGIAVVLLLLIISFFIIKKSYQAQKNKTLQQKLIQQGQQELANIQIETVTPEQVKKYISQENTQLIDIRAKEEFDIKHIESSINIPLSEINEKVGLVQKESMVIIIDREGSTEGKIFTEHLVSEGVNAKYLAGGILAYAQESYTLISIGDPTSTKDLIKVTSISSKEIKQKLLSGERMIFIDVRSKLEHSADHINGSLNFPLEDLEKTKRQLPIGQLLVYDQEQVRSFRAAVRLYDMNVFTIYNCLDSYSTLKKTLFEEDTQTKQNQPAQ